MSRFRSILADSWITTARPGAAWLVRYELVWLAVAAPFLLFPGRGTPFGLALIVTIWGARWIAAGRLTRRTILDRPILVLFLAVGISLAVSVSPARSWLRVPVIILGAAVYYALVNSVREERHIHWLAVGLILAGLGFALVGLLGTDWSALRIVELPGLAEHIPSIIRYAAPGGVGVEFLNPRQVAGALIVFLPISLALLALGPGRGMRLFAGLATAVMGGMLVLTESIPGLAALVVVLFLLAVWRSRWSLMLIPVVLALVVVGLLTYGPREVAATLLSLDNPVGAAVVLRLDIWSRALAMIHDAPLTGTGLDTYQVMQWQFYPGFLLGPEAHAHNLYLQTALDLGVPGLAAFLWLLVAFGKVLVQACRMPLNREQRALLVGAALSVLAHLTYGLMDMTPWGSRTQVGFWAVLGTAAALHALSQQAGSQPEARRRRWAPGAAVLATIGGLVVLLVTIVTGLLTVNITVVRAHRALLVTRETGVPDTDTLEISLMRALGQQPSNAHLYSLLGEVQAWLGEDEQAIQSFRRRVELDGPDPTARYDPAGTVLRLVREKNQLPSYDPIQVYHHWMSRFPERVEPHLLVAIYSCERSANRAMAVRALEKGLARAEPKGPLALYYSKIQESGSDNSHG